MGMVLGVTTASDATIQTLLADPIKVWLLVSPDDLEFYWEESGLAPPGKASLPKAIGSRPGWMARLFRQDIAGASHDPAPEELSGHDMLGLDAAAGEGRHMDFDKSWHGLHYVLTGTAWEGEPPLDFLVHSGQQIGDVEIGYGPARAFVHADIAAIHAALEALSNETLKARYNPAEMDSLDIYPTIWARDGDEGWDYIAEYLDRFRVFLREAVQSRMGLVVTVS